MPNRNAAGANRRQKNQWIKKILGVVLAALIFATFLSFFYYYRYYEIESPRLNKYFSTDLVAEKEKIAIPVPFIFTPVVMLGMDAYSLHMAATNFYLDHYQFAQLEGGLQSLGSGANDGPMQMACGKLQSSLYDAGRSTNQFLEYLDACVDFFTVENPPHGTFNWNGKKLGPNDQYEFYKDAAGKCYVAERFLADVPVILRTIRSSREECQIYIDSEFEKLSRYELGKGNTFYSQLFSSTKTKRSNLRARSIASWKLLLDAMNEASDDREEKNIDYMERVKETLGVVVDLLDIRSAAYQNPKVKNATDTSDMIWEMLAYSYALTNRKHKGHGD